jgi:hypothetical protein
MNDAQVLERLSSAYATLDAPAPSAALAELMDAGGVVTDDDERGAVVVPLVRPRPRVRMRHLVAALVASFVALSGLAVAGALPDSLQRQVSSVVSHLGIDLPRPAPAHDGGDGTGSSGPSSTPGRSGSSATSTTAVPVGGADGPGAPAAGQTGSGTPTTAPAGPALGGIGGVPGGVDTGGGVTTPTALPPVPTLPPITVPQLTLPPVTVPQLTLPPLTVPPLTLPPILGL